MGTLLCIACEEEKKKDPLPFESQEEYEQTMILSHREFLKKEKQEIESFIDSSSLSYEGTGTGLRYAVYEEKEGDSIKTGEIAIIQYLLTSLEGDTLYASPKNKFQEFMVGYDNVESGLHEGITKMRIGEKAKFILPAHLAHGITGDQAAIPTQTTLLYDVYLAAKK